MTNKEFDQQKESIMSLITDEIINNTSKKTVRRLDEVNKLVRELQPPRPTCSTCKHFIPSISLDACINKDSELYRKGLNGKKFGCIYHSDYESK